MNLLIYNLLILILIPVFGFRIMIKSISDKDYRSNFLQRFGFNLSSIANKNKKVIWFHAVSLGEVIGSQGIINKLLIKDFEVIITTTTPSGHRRAKEIYNDDVIINYMPWDFSPFINRFINFYKPQGILIFETEIWPSMISCAYKKNVPLYLVNGRLSQKSYQAYSMFLWFMKKILRQVTFYFVQNENHMQRFLKLGVDKDKIKTVGSVKFDISTHEIREIVSPPFILGGSTHHGEEKLLLKAFKKFVNKRELKLFLCPRHPERADQIVKRAIKMGFKTKLFSTINSHSFDVCVIDSIGMLPSFYAASSMAFVGGSLVPRGGHNLIEPAALGSPIIVGPHTFNFEDIVNQFEQAQACIRVSDDYELLAAIELFANDNDAAEKYAFNAKEIVNKNKGSTDIQASYIITELGEKN
tara:strand:+ start:43 stop:1281 length:1239 start_codon:yes stop_codon:yes gene_type:complete